MGYAGGTKSAPTYRALGDHTETVQVDFDPSQISYDELLDAYWAGHDPLQRSWSRQYAAVIFYHTEAQKQRAERSRDRLTRSLGSSVRTEIVPYTGFTLAEDYHQKHSLRQYSGFLEELGRAYPDPREFIASTAVARVNGYLGGSGSYEALLRELDGLGLSDARKEELRSLVMRRRSSPTCPVPK